MMHELHVHVPAVLQLEQWITTSLLSYSLTGDGEEPEAPDTDEETDRQVAVGVMNQSVANPDQRHQRPGGDDQEEDSGPEERKSYMCIGFKALVYVLIQPNIH